MQTLLHQEFKLLITTTGKDPGRLKELFIRNNGPELLTQLLHDAGYNHGEWTFKVSRRVKGSGGMPPVQVKRVENYGIQLWLRPRDNNSAVKGLLMVMKPLEPEEVFTKLREANNQELLPEDNNVTHIDLEIAEDDVILLLEAIKSQLEESTTYTSINDFISRIANLMGEPLNVGHYLEVAEELVYRNLLLDKKTYYEITTSGYELLSTLDNTLDNNLADIIINSKDKLTDLLSIISELNTNRTKQLELKKKISSYKSELTKLEAQLQEEKKREYLLIKNININSLETLLKPQELPQ